MLLLRLYLASLQLLDEISMHLCDEAVFPQVQHVHLPEDGGDQAVDFEGNPTAAALIDERIATAVRRSLDFSASGGVGRIAGKGDSLSILGLTFAPTQLPRQQFEFFAYPMVPRSGQCICR